VIARTKPHYPRAVRSRPPLRDNQLLSQTGRQDRIAHHPLRCFSPRTGRRVPRMRAVSRGIGELLERSHGYPGGRLKGGATALLERPAESPPIVLLDPVVSACAASDGFALDRCACGRPADLPSTFSKRCPPGEVRGRTVHLTNHETERRANSPAVCGWAPLYLTKERHEAIARCLVRSFRGSSAPVYFENG
jgi:hypothetical protein